MLTSQFNAYIASCVTHNRRPDAAMLATETGISGRELEDVINGAICAFVLSRHEVTGGFGEWRSEKAKAKPIGRAAVPVEQIPCTCSMKGEPDPMQHKYNCKLYHTVYRRQLAKGVRNGKRACLSEKRHGRE